MSQAEVYGISQHELTIAEMVQTAGYTTAMVGKWHLGWPKPFHPAYQGFKEIFGIPYSHDMGCVDHWKKCLYQDKDRVQRYNSSHPDGGRVRKEVITACARGQPASQPASYAFLQPPTQRPVLLTQ